MTSFAFVDATTWIGGHDATGFLNSMSANVTVDELDSTVFGLGGYRRRTGGLRNVAAQFGGFWEAGAGTIDPETFTNLAVADRVITVAPDDAETTVAYMFQGGAFGYQMFGQIGQLTPFSVNYSGTNGVGVVRGQVAKAKADVSATGATGSVVELGDVGSAEFLYATLHVFSAGTTITVQVQSDSASDFASPTTQGTFSGITTAGGTWLARVAGPVADTFFRFNVSAVTGTFSIAGAIGVQ